MGWGKGGRGRNKRIKIAQENSFSHEEVRHGHLSKGKPPTRTEQHWDKRDLKNGTPVTKKQQQQQTATTTKIFTLEEEEEEQIQPFLFLHNGI